MFVNSFMNAFKKSNESLGVINCRIVFLLVEWVLNFSRTLLHGVIAAAAVAAAAAATTDYICYALLWFHAL